jgi:hypothetical protein
MRRRFRFREWEAGRAIRAEWSLKGALIVSNQRRALRAPRFVRSFFPAWVRGVEQGRDTVRLAS